MNNQPFVSVMMPVRNEGAFITRSLGAVLAQDYPSDRMEVIVADGLSTDGTRDEIEALQRRHSNLRLIDNPGGIVSTGVNLAIGAARGDLLLLIGGHCEIASDYVRRCVEHLNTNECDCVGGVLETVGKTFCARAIAAAMSSRFGVGGSSFRVGTKEISFTDTAVFAAYKREIIERVGWFDEELVRNQDDEYNYRLRKLGGRIMTSPLIQSRYYSRATLRKLWRQYFQYGYWKVRVMQKHPRQMQPRQLTPAFFVLSQGLTLLLALVTPLKWPFGAELVVYSIMNLTASVFAAIRTHLRYLPVIAISFATVHVAYGLGFLFGLRKFWRRWGSKRTQADRISQPATPV